MKVSTQAKRRVFAGRVFNPTFATPKGWDKVEAGDELVNVVRKKDGVMVASKIAVHEADALIAKAKAGKKAALMIE